MSAEKVGAPEKLSEHHDISQFNSGVPVLDDWLRRRALPNQHVGDSRTYVVCSRKRLVGYYVLAAGAVAQAGATGRTRRNMPDPIPVIVLGRLAVDSHFQHQGLGRALLRDAVLRTLQAAEIAGIRAILVHAISEDAKRFYELHGFHSSPMDPMTLMITLRDAQQAIE